MMGAARPLLVASSAALARLTVRLLPETYGLLLQEGSER